MIWTANYITTILGGVVVYCRDLFLVLPSILGASGVVKRKRAHPLFPILG
jgi:hypothetical protein